MHQNSQLREKLGRIYSEAADLPPMPTGLGLTDSLMRGAVAPGGLPMTTGSLAYNQVTHFAVIDPPAVHCATALSYVFPDNADHVVCLLVRVLGREGVQHGRRRRFDLLF